MSPLPPPPVAQVDIDIGAPAERVDGAASWLDQPFGDADRVVEDDGEDEENVEEALQQNRQSSAQGWMDAINATKPHTGIR
jgi:hypothetical protein